MVEDTKFYQGDDAASMPSYALDARQKTIENTTELTANPERDKDEEMRQKEDANRSNEKVQEYGFNPEKHADSQAKKMANTNQLE